MTATPPVDPSTLPSLPRFTDYTTCTAPTRKIYTEADLPHWLESEAYHYIELMILRLSVAVDNKTVQDTCQDNDASRRLVDFLKRAEGWIDEIPLQTGPQRFGNKAFRDWMAKLEQHDDEFQRQLLRDEQMPVLPELSHHFLTSFGSAARLDYGTGHELSFLAYLLMLRLIGVFGPEHEQALVTRVFVAYLDVVRKLQRVFKLEPAGSKGVWGLDDHQHLSYLWGASQLRTHPTVRPSSILSPPSISPHGVSYLFLSSILHINDLKSGAPFSEHSPMLHNIASTVPNWSKVSSGLMKMYREEVLKKVPVVQHFWFGSVLPWRRWTQGGEAFKGEVLPSTADSLADDERETIDRADDVRARDESTVAPWALPHLTGVGAPYDRQTAQPQPQRFEPPALFSSASSSSSLASMAGGARRPSSGLARRVDVDEDDDEGQGQVKSTARSPASGQERESVAAQGGAAASSSPFGVLDKARVG